MSNKPKANPMRRAIHWGHFSRIEPGLWPFRHFRPEEIASRDDQSILVDYQALEMLDNFRAWLGVPVFVTSGYRTDIHNVKVGSQPTSLHRQGRAFDIWTHEFTPYDLAQKAEGFGWPGIGLYNTFVHVDDASPRRWGLSF